MHAVRPSRALRRPLAAAILAALAASPLGPGSGAPARAQVHPLPPAPPAVHELLRRGPAAALVEVEAASVDRLRVRRLALLRGSLPGSFAVKRAPSRGGDLGPGDRALLVLDGARPPFVLAGAETPAVLRPGPGEDPEAWTTAVAELAAAGDDPVRLRDLYLRWIDGDLPSLRERALESLAAAGAPARAAPVAPLGADEARRRARLALAPDTSPDRRLLEARLAATRAEGALALLAGLPASPAAAELLPLAIRAGRIHGLREATRTALLRGLGHPEAPVRSAAVRAARLAEDGEVLAALARLAETDPEPRIRERAARLLASRGGTAPSPPGEPSPRGPAAAP